MNNECLNLVKKARDRLNSARTVFKKILPPNVIDNARNLYVLMSQKIPEKQVEETLFRYSAALRALRNSVIGNSDDEELARQLFNQAAKDIDNAIKCTERAAA